MTALLDCKVCDRIPITSRTTTDEGFMVAPARIASVGVQTYRAWELGLDKDGVARDTLFRLYRPPESVFEQAAMDSFNRKPITFKHPPKGQDVDAKNWRQLAVGDVHDVRRDGDTHLGATVWIRDAAAVKAVDAGTKALSNGYRFKLRLDAGVTPDGQAYDGIMTEIRGNHTAIVDTARGGPGCRVADDDDNDDGKGATSMALTTKVYDGISVEVEGQVASVLDKLFRDHADDLKAAQDSATAFKTRAETAEAEVTRLKGEAVTTKTAHDAALAAAKALELKPEARDELVRARGVLIADAGLLVKDFNGDGKSDLQVIVEALRAATAADESLKEVVVAALDGVELDKALEPAARLAFRTAVAVHKRATAQASDGSEGGDGGEGGDEITTRRASDAARRATDSALANPRRDAPSSGNGNGQGVVRAAKKPIGRDGYTARTSDAWTRQTAKDNEQKT